MKWKVIELYRHLIELVKRKEYKDPQAMADFRIAVEEQLGVPIKYLARGNSVQQDLYRRYNAVGYGFKLVRCRYCGGLDVRSKEIEFCFWCKHIHFSIPRIKT